MAKRKSEWFIDRKVELRRDDDGGFDELVLYGASGKCILHAEMMDDKTLWMGVYPPGERKDRSFAVWVSARGKLRVSAEED